MYTIYDYLKYYKDYSIKELNFNMMDNLFLSILIYMPIKNFYYKEYKDLVNEILEYKEETKDMMVPKLKELLNVCKDSKRYSDMKFYNYINRVDEYTQFGAFTAIIDNIKIISFKGSDGSVIGWLENFRLSYSYPTYTQQLAIDYLNNNIGLFDKNIYVTGHSKGGNLALVSSMELSNYKYKKIRNIINFDGPGVKYSEFISSKYNRLKDKLINIIPSSSYIGTLLFNDNYKVIKSNTHGLAVHYPNTWNIFGIEFIEEKISKLSNELIKKNKLNMKDIDSEKLKKIFENAFKVYSQRETSHMKMNIVDAFNMIKNISKSNLFLKEYTGNIISIMKNLNKDNKNLLNIKNDKIDK